MKVWSCIFAMNVQSVSAQHLNWNLISKFRLTTDSFAVSCLTLAEVTRCRQLVHMSHFGKKFSCKGHLKQHMQNDMKVWSCIFAMNVQSVSAQHSNWNLTSKFILTTDSFAVSYVTRWSNVNAMLSDTSRNVLLFCLQNDLYIVSGGALNSTHSPHSSVDGISAFLLWECAVYTLSLEMQVYVNWIINARRRRDILCVFSFAVWEIAGAVVPDEFESEGAAPVVFDCDWQWSLVSLCLLSYSRCFPPSIPFVEVGHVLTFPMCLPRCASKY